MKTFDAVKKSLRWLTTKYSSIHYKFMMKDGFKPILGRKFSLGAEFQYELAKNLFKDKRFLIFVDKPIKLPNRTQNVYPDILIIKKKRSGLFLIGLIEIKMDCGWINKHGLNKTLAVYNKIAKSHSFSYKESDDEADKSKSKFNVNVPKRIKRIFIIVSKINHEHRINEYVKKNIRKAGFDYLVLLEKRHPNRDNVAVVLKDLELQKKNINKILRFG